MNVHPSPKKNRDDNNETGAAAKISVSFALRIAGEVVQRIISRKNCSFKGF